MESVFGLNPYVAQFMVWFLGFIAVALFGTIACFIAGLTHPQGGRV